MTKKTLCLILVAICVLGLAGCKSKKPAAAAPAPAPRPSSMVPLYQRLHLGNGVAQVRRARSFR